MRSRLLISLVVVIVSRCAVEVGNPGGKTEGGGAGNLTVQIAQDSGETGESFLLNVEDIQLIEAGESNSSGLSLTGIRREVSLLSQEEATDVDLANGENLTPGKYRGIAIRLNRDRPAVYGKTGNPEEILALDDSDANTVVFEQELEITSGETTVVIVRLDPRRSIEAGGEGRRRYFRPRAHMGRKKRGVVHEVETDSGHVWVCAYAYEPLAPLGVHPEGRPMAPMRPMRPMPPMEAHMLQPPPSPKERIKRKMGRQQRRVEGANLADGAPPPDGPGPDQGLLPPNEIPSPEPDMAQTEEGLPPAASKPLGRHFVGQNLRVFTTKNEVVKDENSQCDNAFARARVRDKKARFRHLVPAHYDFRGFDDKGAFKDLESDVGLAPDR